MKTPRKTWQTPQVFVLGAEGTQAFKTGGVNEDLVHLVTQTVHLLGTTNVKVAGSDNIAQGYES